MGSADDFCFASNIERTQCSQLCFIKNGELVTKTCADVFEKMSDRGADGDIITSFYVSCIVCLNV